MKNVDAQTGSGEGCPRLDVRGRCEVALSLDLVLSFCTDNCSSAEPVSGSSPQTYIPGMLMGGYAGNRLGAIRDAKSKSVAAVFTELHWAPTSSVVTHTST